MSDLRFAQARGVVLERKLLLAFVKVESAQTVGIGKFSEAAQLRFRERILKFVSDFDECHGGIIPQRSNRHAFRS